MPRGFVARMRRGDATDPLLLQVLPRAAELGDVPGFARDAVGDLDARTGRGVLHKYRGPRTADRDRFVRGAIAATVFAVTFRTPRRRPRRIAGTTRSPHFARMHRSRK